MKRIILTIEEMQDETILLRLDKEKPERFETRKEVCEKIETFLRLFEIGEV